MPLRYEWPMARMLKWYDKGATTVEIAAKLGTIKDHLGSIHVPTAGGVLRALRKAGCKIRPNGACGERNGSWKGGRRIDDNGYVWVLRRDHPYATTHGYVQEHRLVAEKVLGRYLDPKEVVHHDDDDRQNNRPSNLIVYPDNATHLRETRKGKRPNWTPEGWKRLLQRRKERAKKERAARDVKAARTPKPSAGIRLV